MKPLPLGVEPYRRTPTFTESTVPAGLLTAHETKPGVWGQIVVERGRLRYDVLESDEKWVLEAGQPGIIEPEVRHKVTPLGPVAFHVAFYR